jgi:hypothetical protein
VNAVSGTLVNYGRKRFYNIGPCSVHLDELDDVSKSEAAVCIARIDQQFYLLIFEGLKKNNYIYLIIIKDVLTQPDLVSNRLYFK